MTYRILLLFSHFRKCLCPSFGLEHGIPSKIIRTPSWDDIALYLAIPTVFILRKHLQMFQPRVRVLRSRRKCRSHWRFYPCTQRVDCSIPHVLSRLETIFYEMRFAMRSHTCKALEDLL